jgi:hypothetical protein
MPVNSYSDAGSQKSDGDAQKGDGDAEEAQASKKQSKKEKGKHKKKSQDKAKLKKEAQKLRLASLSEGLENVTFSGLKRNVEPDVEIEDSGLEKLENKTHNGFVNGGSTKKSRVQKRKADETGHNIMTNKKVR